jgi:hypothetical protein
MSSSDPVSPARADHRFIKKILEISFPGKVVYLPSEISQVSQVFVLGGGSWERVFQGSAKDIKFLKRVVKVAIRLKKLTSKESWDHGI